MKPFALALALALALLAAGCATVPLAPETPDHLVTRAQAPDTATIFVARPGVLGTAILGHVMLDGVLVGSLAVKTYLQLDVAPGMHTLSVNMGGNVRRTQVVTDAGHQYFFTATLQPLDTHDGAKAVKRSRLALRLDR